MNYCKNCEVDLDADMSACPLCGMKVGEDSCLPERNGNKQSEFRDKTLHEIDNLSGEQKQKLFWEVSGIILACGILVTLIINLMLSGSITWAKYVLVASITAFIDISLLIFLRHHYLVLIISSMLTLVAMFLIIDNLSSANTWGVQLAVPVTVSFHVLLLITVWLIRISNQLGFNVIALVFMVAGVFLVSIEVFTSQYTHGSIHLKWSVIAAASVLTISAFLIFVHYRLKKGIELKRFFHI